MPEANAKEGQAAFDNGLANRRLLCHQPGILLFFPDIHRSAHDPECVIAIQARNRCVLIELNGVPFDAILRQEIAEDPRVLDAYVLENEDAHGRTRRAVYRTAIAHGTGLSPCSTPSVRVFSSIASYDLMAERRAGVSRKHRDYHHDSQDHRR